MSTETDISALYREFTDALTEVLAENAVGLTRRGRLARARAAVKKHPEYSARAFGSLGPMPGTVVVRSTPVSRHSGPSPTGQRFDLAGQDFDAFGDRLRIAEVILLSFAVRTDVFRRH